VRGAGRIARFLANGARRFSGMAMERAVLNGEPGVIVYDGAKRTAAMAFHVENGRVQAVHIVVNDEKLAALDRHLEVI
jgi:hypothetical protein